MTTPVRIQRKRTKGFDMQAASRAINGLPAVYVGRPTMWGNPFTSLNDSDEMGAVTRYRKMLVERPSLQHHQLLKIARGMNGRGVGYFGDIRARIGELRGKNLACWCAGSPCHADVLLELANRPVCEAAE